MSHIITICLSAAALLALLIPGTAAQFQLTCSNLASQQIQGVIPVASQLHLFINDHHYQIPFTGDYISSDHAMIALFKQTNAAPEQMLTTEPKHWTEVEGFASVVARLGGKKKAMRATLLAVYLLQSPESESSGTMQYHLLFKDKNFRVNQTTGEILAEEPKELTNRYAILSNGRSSQNYIIRYNSEHKVVFTTGTVVQNGHVGTFFSTVLGSRVYFSSTSTLTGGTPLVTDPALTFGFIHQNAVHIWDFTNRQVYLFPHPPEGYLTTDDKGSELTTERMSSYFICSKNDWELKIAINQKKQVSGTSKDASDGSKEPSGPTSGTSTSYFKWWQIVLLASLAFMLTILLVVVYLMYRYPSKICRKSQRCARAQKKNRSKIHARSKKNDHLSRKPSSTLKLPSHQTPTTESPESFEPPDSSSFDPEKMLNCRVASSSMPTEKQSSRKGGSGGGFRRKMMKKSLFVAKLPSFSVDTAHAEDTSKLTRIDASTGTVQSNDPERLYLRQKAPTKKVVVQVESKPESKELKAESNVTPKGNRPPSIEIPVDPEGSKFTEQSKNS